MAAPSLDTRYSTLHGLLEKHQQAHLLNFYADLDDEQKERLLDDLEAQDWSRLERLIEQYVLTKTQFKLPSEPQPAPYYPLEPAPELKGLYEEARALGEGLIREGKVAAFTVAGGQGTRLGWDGPKGTFPATPIEGKPLFRVFAESIRKTEAKYGATVPWYIMTSPINDTATRAFFAEHDHFGLDAKNIMFFPQGTLPSLGLDGRVLLNGKGQVALNPDGHGGSLKALYERGALADMQRRGIEQLSYFQVDNPNVKCVDPLFIGLHALEGAQMSSKMLPKSSAREKVGNFSLINGRINVIEYSDMPDALAEATHPDGSLKFKAGSIAIHVIATDFIRRLNEESDLALPYHRAEKKVSYLDPDSGTMVEPDRINSVKLEMFVFDALSLAEKSIILETDRVEEFAPIKNAEGDDSPQSSKALQSERAARWLERHGVKVPRNGTGVDATIELSPLTAVEPADLAGVNLPEHIAPDSRVLL